MRPEVETPHLWEEHLVEWGVEVGYSRKWNGQIFRSFWISAGQWVLKIVTHLQIMVHAWACSSTNKGGISPYIVVEKVITH